ncbi:uncharacterized protein [Temnothorax longispinosus]|uniref:uncharacterized protein isoform X2 n=1 Tax=Temnothorax longispinosus TaxID=300112 RepID=UPI003A9955B4
MLEQPQTTDGEESNTWILFLVRDGTMEARFNDEADLHNERQSFTEQVFSWILRENLHKVALCKSMFYMAMHNYYHRALHGAPVLRAARVGDRRAAPDSRDPAGNVKKHRDAKGNLQSARQKAELSPAAHIIRTRCYCSHNGLVARAHLRCLGNRNLEHCKKNILILVQKVLLNSQ